MNFSMPGLELMDSSVEDELGRISMDDLVDAQPQHSTKLEGASPLLEKLWRCALSDVESNLLEFEGKPYFSAGGRGQGWLGNVFTRDIAYASILGLRDFFPAPLFSSLKVTRNIRLKIGLLVDRDQYFDDFNFQKEDISHDDFRVKYKTNPYLRRTDDVVWLWWAEDLLLHHFDLKKHWHWLYTTGIRCFEELYAPFYDPSDGLYFGQSSFVDIGPNGYPEEFGADGVPSYRACLRIKATSTNCLYYKGFMVMANVARRLGYTEEAQMWDGKAKDLRKNIRIHLMHPDGTVAYFKHESGILEQRQHTLSTAFMILFDILTGEEAIRAITNYPICWWGVPLIHPFYLKSATYHNNSSWFFSDSFFLRAKEKALGVSHVEQELAILARSCHGGTFFEWNDAINKVPSGKPAQLWTLGAFIGACQRAGFGMHSM